MNQKQFKLLMKALMLNNELGLYQLNLNQNNSHLPTDAFLKQLNRMNDELKKEVHQQEEEHSNL